MLRHVDLSCDAVRKVPSGKFNGRDDSRRITSKPAMSSLFTPLSDALVQSISSFLSFDERLALAATAKCPRGTEHDPFTHQLITSVRIKVPWGEFYDARYSRRGGADGPWCEWYDASPSLAAGDPSRHAARATREAQRCIPGILRRLTGVTTLVLGPDPDYGPLIAGLAAAIRRQGCRWIDSLRFEGLESLKGTDLHSIIRALKESVGGLPSLTTLSLMDGVEAAIPLAWVGEFVDLCPRLETVAVTISREDPRQFAWALDARDRRLSSELSPLRWSRLRRLSLRLSRGRAAVEPEWWAYLFQQGRVFKDLESLSLHGHFEGAEMEAVGRGLASRHWRGVALRELDIGVTRSENLRGGDPVVDDVIRAMVTHKWPLECLKLEAGGVGANAIAELSEAVRGGSALRGLRELHIRHLTVTNPGAAEPRKGSIVEGHGCPLLHSL
jgi:hypothetical protein